MSVTIRTDAGRVIHLPQQTGRHHQMGIIRSVTTRHSAAPDVEWRIGRHQPYKQVVTKMEPDGDPYPVVELWLRDYDGTFSMKGTFKMESFIELSRDVARIGKELCPPSEDENSNGEVLS